ncbi:aldo/keto reductase [Spirosoma endophyticum]|uniref:Aldo/keto reductase n=1 Tax=Spirosoma endophyticum TaxID=662367 RepID=A0A1I1WIL8_9BACT|nr:aldo/keto reductase [Spirosoma endophyticum]SFD92950.1 Aldo/keto reductase [Spirosoma endophyticum]
MLTRLIPSSKEALPVVGLGTWQTFDVLTPSAKEPLKDVLKTMHQYGGTLIDSSPMYGRSEGVVGELTAGSDLENQFFYATKVWTQGREAGIQQMNESFRLMRRKTMDLMQIHNLTDWKTHIKTLKDWKAAGKIRYIGITHYTDSMHGELEQILSSVPIDFVQFNYSIVSRNAEKRLLPAAAEHGVATLINRPLGEGGLFAKVRGKNLPDWVKEYGIESWGQFFLKFLLSHAAVTCVIPGTSKPDHMADNAKAGIGPLPDKATREKMAALVASF